MIEFNGFIDLGCVFECEYVVVYECLRVLIVKWCGVFCDFRGCVFVFGNELLVEVLIVEV